MSATQSVSGSAQRAPVRRLLLFVPAVLVALGALLVAAHAHVPEGQVAPGVHVGELDLGGKSQEEARVALEKWVEELHDHPLILRYAPETGRAHEWKTTAQKLGLSVDVAATLTKTLQAGREGGVGRVTEWISGNKPATVAAVASVDDNALQGALKEIAHAVNRAPKNARFVFRENGGYGPQHGEPGIALDLESSSSAIRKAWDTLLGAEPASPSGPSASEEETHAKTQTPASPTAPSQSGATVPAVPTTPTVVNLVMKAIPPSVASADLAQIDGKIGEMKTYIRGTPDRVTNVTVATRHINGTLLRPGEIFSYNQVVGPRSEDGGYEKAIIFKNGRHVEDIGGGICQTASTLYNAVLKAGLKVVRRQPHCTPVVYVPYGLDATVAYGAVDFQFQNDSDSPVYIYAKASGRNLTFALYGKTDPNRRVVLQKLSQSSVGNSTEVIHDPHLRPGRRVVKDKGARGYSIAWRRTIYENGHSVRSEVISSHYRPIPALVMVGPGVAAQHGAAKPGRAGTTPQGATPNPATAPTGGPGATVPPPTHGP